MKPERYEAWYHTPRGRWIGEREFTLLWQLLQPPPASSLLDVGCGTGHFSRRFAAAGLQVTGIDPDPAMLAFATAHNCSVPAERHDAVHYLQADARALPFRDNSFEDCAAITSLCFVAQPQRALQEMWRVARRGVILGLLNRHSLLYRHKRHSPGYAGARWDSRDEVQAWIDTLAPRPQAVRQGTAVFLPSADAPARAIESLLSPRIPWGGFMAVALFKSGQESADKPDPPQRSGA